MNRVRPFIWTDIPQVARLHRLIFKPGARTDSAGLESHYAYFTRVFLDNPSRDARLPSLVYEEDDGRVVGFLGVVPRRMSIDGQTIQAAISSQCLADPASHTDLVAVELAKTFLDGPQDLSISDEADDVARRIWEGLGGMTALLRSMHWTRPLRPARLALSYLRNRAGLVALASLADPPARLVDALATRLRHSHLYQSMPAVSADDRLEETFLTRQPEFAGPGSLRVDYDDRTFSWLLERARQKKTGRLQKAVIRNGSEVMGWYLYHLDRQGMANVLQIAAKTESIHEVLDHLFYQTWRQGAIAVTGRLEPRFLEALSDKYCLFHRRGPWMLVSARKAEFLRPFQNGSAFFSRFDGEWCLGF